MALQLRFHVLDLEMMAAQISPDTLLVDNTHPGPDFMMQVGLTARAGLMSNTCSSADCMPCTWR